MSSSSIHNKTIRPGSLNGYYYYSGRQQPVAAPVQYRKASKRRIKLPIKWMAIPLVLAALIGLPLLRNDARPVKTSLAATASRATGPSMSQSTDLPQANAPSASPVTLAANRCSGNTEHKLIKVSVEQRHLWACEGNKTAKDVPVITGLRGHAETETPAGTYKIYAKQTNTTLTGQDSRGAWKYPVYFWMPFLDNQYGTYGFHDATWRAADSFGNISPDSTDASHGCVELPKAAQEWLYHWAPVGTSVVIES